MIQIKLISFIGFVQTLSQICWQKLLILIIDIGLSLLF